MPNSKRKNVAKARVFNILIRNFLEQPRVAEIITAGENCIWFDTAVDNDIPAFCLITCQDQRSINIQNWEFERSRVQLIAWYEPAFRKTLQRRQIYMYHEEAITRVPPVSHY